MTDRRTNNTVMVPLLAGLVGAGLAMLFAPRSGRETRKKIHETAQDLQTRARHDVSDARHKLDDSVESAKDMTSRISEVIKNRGKTVKKQLDELEEPTGPDHTPYTNNWNQE